MVTDPADSYAREPSDSNLPIPDPTRLTTQLVDRALNNFREVVETRLAAMDTATELLAKELEKINDDTGGQHRHMRDDFDRQVNSLRELLVGKIMNVSEVSEERFKAVATQFTERDTRISQAEVERQKSLDAALAAAKEAVAAQQTANAASAAALQAANSEAIGKSELAIKEKVDALVTLMTTSNKAMDDKIADLKERLDQSEGRRGGHDTSIRNLATIIGLVIAALAVAVTVIVSTR
jgi:hypothetical protein